MRCNLQSVTGSQFCCHHKDSERAVNERLNLFTAIQDGRRGGPLLEVIQDGEGRTHVLALRELLPMDIVTIVSGEIASAPDRISATGQLGTC